MNRLIQLNELTELLAKHTSLPPQLCNTFVCYMSGISAATLVKHKALEIPGLGLFFVQGGKVKFTPSAKAVEEQTSASQPATQGTQAQTAAPAQPKVEAGSVIDTELLTTAAGVVEQLADSETPENAPGDDPFRRVLMTEIEEEEYEEITKPIFLQNLADDTPTHSTDPILPNTQPKQPETPQPWKPQQPEIPEPWNPQASQQPEIPAPWNPQAPQQPEIPEPWNPQAPQQPENPQPWNPQAPQQPEIPKPWNPQAPQQPENPQPWNPQAPQQPEIPEPWNPQAPQQPETPQPWTPQQPESQQQPWSPQPESPQPWNMQIPKPETPQPWTPQQPETPKQPWNPQTTTQQQPQSSQWGTRSQTATAASSNPKANEEADRRRHEILGGYSNNRWGSREKNQKKKKYIRIATIAGSAIVILILLAVLIPKITGYLKSDSKKPVTTQVTTTPGENGEVQPAPNDSVTGESGTDTNTIDVEAPGLLEGNDEYRYDIISSSRTLVQMARDYYGHKDYWIYIYLDNQDVITNPNSIKSGTKLRIPPRSKYDVNNDPIVNLKEARKLGNQTLQKFKN